MELPDREKDCRACMTVDQLMQRARELTLGKRKSEAKKEQQTVSTGPSTSGAKNETQEVCPPVRRDCPVNTEQLGRSTWDLLHTMAAYYPEEPGESEKKDMKTMINVLGKVYPCPHCAKGLRDHVEKHPPDLRNREGLSLWMCDMHNRVSEMLGKPKFDCSRWKERWLDGWKDGSCDY